MEEAEWTRRSGWNEIARPLSATRRSVHLLVLQIAPLQQPLTMFTMRRKAFLKHHLMVVRGRENLFSVSLHPTGNKATLQLEAKRSDSRTQVCLYDPLAFVALWYHRCNYSNSTSSKIDYRHSGRQNWSVVGGCPGNTSQLPRSLLLSRTETHLFKQRGQLSHRLAALTSCLGSGLGGFAGSEGVEDGDCGFGG